MMKILKYSLYDLLRSRWLIIYLLFFFVSTLLLFRFTGSFPRAVVSLLSIELSVVPLVSLVFGMMYFYNSREYIELLLAQPISRKTIFAAIYCGLALSLSICYLVGTTPLFLIYGIKSGDISSFLLYESTGFLLTLIFSAFSCVISVAFDNKIKGFGLAIILWLYMAVLYDGIFLLLLTLFQDYPAEKMTLVLTILNPVDLTRVLVLLKLDISAMMGYSGAVFRQFFGTGSGIAIAFLVLVLWIIVPVFLLLRVVRKKDF